MPFATGWNSKADRPLIPLRLCAYAVTAVLSRASKAAR